MLIHSPRVRICSTGRRHTVSSRIFSGFGFLLAQQQPHLLLHLFATYLYSPKPHPRPTTLSSHQGREVHSCSRLKSITSDQRRTGAKMSGGSPSYFEPNVYCPIKLTSKASFFSLISIHYISSQKRVNFRTNDKI